MSSSSQFPCGLSNWTGADKPTRADFVRDNGLLDENALWKQDYDPTGAVAARGGISEYALDRDRYDQDGSVAAAGGISAYLGLDPVNMVTLERVYPVGSIYFSIISTNPSEYFGGTWVQLGAGRVPVGISTETEFNTVEKLGGDKTHTLTATQMPQHTHTSAAHNHTLGQAYTHTGGATTYRAPASASGLNIVPYWEAGNIYTGSVTPGPTGSAGSGAAHNNLQPYITCYMWKRTA